MRIRKRPLSSLSPVLPLSDPVVQLQLQLHSLPEEDDTAEYFNAPSSSDQQIQTHPIQLGTTAPKADLLQKDEGESNNDTRSNLLGAKTDTSHDLQAFPIVKKRRGNKKCVQEEDEEEEKMKKKKGNRVRGGALMEGSRCSRVNGRGWRCCQQTLVGYSLCEHHLGKGRLRSMTTTVPTRSRSNDYKTKLILDDEDENNNNNNKALMSKRKTKTKLGFVKARSMSSLLGQGNNVIS